MDRFRMYNSVMRSANYERRKAVPSKRKTLEDVQFFMGPAKRHLRYIWSVRGGLKLAIPVGISRRFGIKEGDKVAIRSYAGEHLVFNLVVSGHEDQAKKGQLNRLLLDLSKHVKKQGDIAYISIGREDNLYFHWQKGDAILYTERATGEIEIENLTQRP